MAFLLIDHCHPWTRTNLRVEFGFPDHHGVRVKVFNATFNNILLFKLYRGRQFCWWMKPEYREKTTDLQHDTDKLDHIMLHQIHQCVSLQFVFAIKLNAQRYQLWQFEAVATNTKEENKILSNSPKEWSVDFSKYHILIKTHTLYKN
jgi:hypothetical protein